MRSSRLTKAKAKPRGAVHLRRSVRESSPSEEVQYRRGLCPEAPWHGALLRLNRGPWYCPHSDHMRPPEGTSPGEAYRPSGLFTEAEAFPSER